LTDVQSIERLLDVRRFKDAEERIHAAIAENPDDPNAHYYLGRLAYETGDIPQAKVHAYEALARDPQSRNARRMLVAIHDTLREWPEQEAVLLDLLRETPEMADLLGLYAELMLKTLFVDRARALVAEAIRHDPATEQARLVLVRLALVDGHEREALRMLGELLAEKPQSFHLAAVLFDTLVAQRRFFQAEEVGKELVRARPDSERIVRLLIEVRLKTHPLGWPAYPYHRLGWPVPALLVVLSLVAVVQAEGSPLGFVLLGFTVYWTLYIFAYAGLLRWWIERRGI
jgi:predicted Zn-dependent protease